MIWDDATLDLLTALYAASLEPDGWNAWSRRAMEWFGGAGLGFSVWDRKSTALRHQIRIASSESSLDRYAQDEMWRLDPQMPVLNTVDRVHVFADVDYLDRAAPPVREYMRWMTDNAGLNHHLSVGVPVGEGLIAGFSVHRRVDDGVVPEDHRRHLTAIAPHIAHALHLGFRKLH